MLEKEGCGSKKNLKFEIQLTLDPKPIHLVVILVVKMAEL